MAKTTNWQMSVDARLLYERLKLAAVDELVSYKELSVIVRRDVQNEARGILETARRRCMKEDMIVFGTVVNEGLKRLSPSGTIQAGEFFVRHIKKTARKGIATISCLTTEQFNSLSNEEKVMHNTNRSALGILEHISRPSGVKKIEGAVTKEQTALPLAKTLELFK